MNKIKKYFYFFLLLELLFSYTPAYAQTTTQTSDYSNAGVSAQIKKYLCAPNEVPASQTGYNPVPEYGSGALDAAAKLAAQNNNNSGVLYQCINQLYKFAIVVASVMGVFFLVIAGYVYMSAEGNSESVEKAKSIMTSTIASLVILFAGFILLKAINPDLIQFHSIQPPSVVGGTVGGNPIVGGGISGTVIGGKSNYCSTSPTFKCDYPAVLSRCALYDSYAQQYGASIPNVNGPALLKAIMIHESGCQPQLVSATQDYGLMQMKLTTANNPSPNFRAQCGITGTVDGDWFKSNPGLSVCLSAAYLKYLSPSCGSDVGLLISGYANGNCTSSSVCRQAVSEILTCYNP